MKYVATTSSSDDDRQRRQVAGQGAEHRGEVRDHEPVLVLDGLGPVRDAGQVERTQVRRPAGTASGHRPGAPENHRSARNAATPTAMMLIATPETMWSTPKITVASACSAPPMAPKSHRCDDGLPRAVVVAEVARPDGAQDHHALEADVDHAGALGPEAGEAGQRDRDEGGDRLAQGAGRVELVAAGDHPGEGDQREARRSSQPTPAPCRGAVETSARPWARAARWRRSCRDLRLRCGAGRAVRPRRAAPAPGCSGGRPRRRPPRSAPARPG